MFAFILSSPITKSENNNETEYTDTAADISGLNRNTDLEQGQQEFEFPNTTEPELCWRTRRFVAFVVTFACILLVAVIGEHENIAPTSRICTEVTSR